MKRLGQRLAEERHRRGLTLEQVSVATKIKTPFLSYIETGEYNLLPSSAYAQGFVKNYIEFLGLPVQESLAVFRREFDGEKAIKVLPEGLPRQKEYSVKRFHFHIPFLFISVLILFVFYVLFQYRYAFFSPPLEIVKPLEGEAFLSQSVLVAGTTDANASVFINEDSVSVDQNGKFEKTVHVFSGKQLIKIRVVNRFGKETVIERHITASGS